MEILLEQERLARLSKNSETMYQIMTEIVSNCHNDNELITYLKLLSKRKAQLKECLKTTIRNVFNDKLSKVKTEGTDFIHLMLTEIVEGKFFLEEERVYFTRTLKELYEGAGDCVKALDVIFDVPIETFDVPEDVKITYQLETLRLCVKNKEWSKSELVSRRVRQAYFKETNDKAYECNFYTSMIGVSLGQRQFYETACFFKKLYETDQTDSVKRILYCSFFSLICEDNSGRDTLLKFCLDCKDNNENMRKIIRLFHGNLIIPLKLSEVVKEFDEQMNFFIDDFFAAINEHNLKIVSLFFRRIKFDDLKNILQCSEEECVKLISTCVSKRGGAARIDQAKGLVIFDIKSEGKADDKISDVLDRLVRVSYLISKEKLSIIK